MASKPRLFLWLLCGLLCCSVALPRSTVASEWNTAVLAAIRPQTPTPLLLARNLAVLHRSLYDAMLLGDGEEDPIFFEPELSVLSLEQPGDIDPELIAAYAAHTVASTYFPSAKPLFDQLLEEQCLDVDETMRAQARALGTRCANIHLSARDVDRLSSTITYRPKTEPGQWRRTPPKFRPPELPQGRNLTPFAIDDVEELLPPGPPELDSTEWAKAFIEIFEIGGKNSSLRTEEQALIAHFWSDFSYTITPPGHWNEIAIEIAANKALSAREQAHILAWLNTTLVDAGIVCWEAKYHYNFWRPLTAIYEADRDERPETQPDFSWDAYLVNPPHPEYPSGHSSFSGAAARFLQLYFDRDDLEFSATSDSVPGHRRHFNSLWDCANEISMSRIYGGIHFQFSGDDGLALGAKVAEEVFLIAKP